MNNRKSSKNIFIGCLGDSLTDGHPGYSSYYNEGMHIQSTYQYWLKKCIKQDFAENNQKDRDIIFINKGICGETTDAIARRLYPEVIYLSKDRYHKKPDCVIIVGGTNDLGWDVDIDHTVQNIIQMHQICRNESILSIGATVPPTQFEHDGNYNTKKTSLNQTLIQFFSSERVPFVNLYTGMGTNSNNANLNPKYDSGDGLHFSVAGYKKMGELIFYEAVQKVLLVP